MEDSIIWCVKYLHREEKLRVAEVLPLQLISKRFDKEGIIQWKDSLISHFPSYYLQREEQYSVSKEVNWKNEYIEAYRSFSLRYCPGGSIANNKVVHFGPLGYDPQEYAVSKNSRAIPLGFPYVIYGDKSYCVDNGILKEMEGIDDSVGLACIQLSENFVIDNGKLIAGPYVNYTSIVLTVSPLQCYDIETGKKLWEKKCDAPYRVAAFENKVFALLEGNVLHCLDVNDGNTLFTIDARGLEVSEVKPLGHLNGMFSLVFDGDYVVWDFLHKGGIKYVRANWKTQTRTIFSHKQFAALVPGEIDRFTVDNGILYAFVVPDNAGETDFAAFDISSDEPKLLWKHPNNNRREGGPTHKGSPCVYGDLIFTISFDELVDRSYDTVTAFNKKTGAIVWRLSYQEDNPNGRSCLLDMHVVEGRADLKKRKEAIVKRKTELKEAKDAKGAIYFAWEEPAHFKVIYSSGYKEVFIKNVEKTFENSDLTHTTLPVLRFMTFNNARNTYFLAGVLAETGDVVFTKKAVSEHNISPHSAHLAISKNPECKFFAI